MLARGAWMAGPAFGRQADVVLGNSIAAATATAVTATAATATAATAARRPELAVGNRRLVPGWRALPVVAATSTVCSFVGSKSGCHIHPKGHSGFRQRAARLFVTVESGLGCDRLLQWERMGSPSVQKPSSQKSTPSAARQKPGAEPLKRILVTGSAGFVGPWVIADLRRRFPGAVLYGGVRQTSSLDGRLARADVTVPLDLRRPEQVDAAVRRARPDAVIHLASRKAGPEEELVEDNVNGCERLLQALAGGVPDARIVVIGSSAELGRSPEVDVPLAEDSPCNPVDPYGRTKLAQSQVAARQAALGQQVIRLRPFNVIGPAMPDTLLAGRCAALLRAASEDGPTQLEFGPLDTRRDYVDVRDLASAISAALSSAPAGALYHVGSGQSRSGHELVEDMIVVSGRRNVTFRCATAAGASAVPWQTADIGRANEELDWRPSISWSQSLRDLWEWTGASGRAAERVALA